MNEVPHPGPLSRGKGLDLIDDFESGHSARKLSAHLALASPVRRPPPSCSLLITFPNPIVSKQMQLASGLPSPTRPGILSALLMNPGTGA
jgi:hypothetical protein